MIKLLDHAENSYGEDAMVTGIDLSLWRNVTRHAGL